MANVGFDCIVDVGLGRTAADFDRYRVTVCDRKYPIDKHFEKRSDAPESPASTQDYTYRRLEEEIGACGAAEIAGASIAAPYVSALAAAVAITRLISVVSDRICPVNEVRKISSPARRMPRPLARADARGASRAGTPDLLIS